MLRARIFTAIILAPLVIAAVFYSSAAVFAFVFCVITGLGMYEWAGLAGYQTRLARLSYVSVYAALCAIFYALPTLQVGVLVVGAMFWLLAIVGVLLYPGGASLYSVRALLAFSGWLAGICAWLALVQIHALPEGPLWVIWMLFLIWAADVGAYFAGRSMGRRALAPAVSPGKTWEGAAGGVLLAVGVCGTAAVLWQGGWHWYLFSGVIVAISIFGDLFESVLKRSSDTKDSGTLLPGHGGMLDRIDSLLAALPFAALWLVG